VISTNNYFGALLYFWDVMRLCNRGKMCT